MFRAPSASRRFVKEHPQGVPLFGVERNTQPRGYKRGGKTNNSRMFYAVKCRCGGCFSYFIQSLSRIMLKNVIFCGINYTEPGGLHVPGGKTVNNFFTRSVVRHDTRAYVISAEAAPLQRGMSYGQENRCLPGEYTVDKRSLRSARNRTKRELPVLSAYKYAA